MALAKSVLERGQPVFTFNDDENNGLLDFGARLFHVDKVKSLWTGAPISETDTSFQENQ